MSVSALQTKILSSSAVFPEVSVSRGIKNWTGVDITQVQLNRNSAGDPWHFAVSLKNKQKTKHRHITYFLWILYEYALHLHIKLLFLLPQVAIFVHFEIIFILDSCLFLRLLHFSFLQPYSTFLFWQSRQIYRHLSKQMNKIKLKTTHQLT